MRKTRLTAQERRTLSSQSRWTGARGLGAGEQWSLPVFWKESKQGAQNAVSGQASRKDGFLPAGSILASGT